MNKVSQEQLTLNALRRGDKTNYQLAQIALKYTSIISALREDGHKIVATRKYVGSRATGTWTYHLDESKPRRSVFSILSRGK